MIYYAQTRDGPIKIGYSENPQARVAHIQCNNPYPLNLIGLHLGDEAEESAIHTRLQGHRVRNRGEWYWPCGEVLSCMLGGMMRDLPSEMVEGIRRGDYEADLAMPTLTLKERGWQPNDG